MAERPRGTWHSNDHDTTQNAHSPEPQRRAPASGQKASAWDTEKAWIRLRAAMHDSTRDFPQAVAPSTSMWRRVAVPSRVQFGGIALAATLVAGVLATWSASRSHAPGMNVVQTGPGERRLVRLDDGSIVELAPDSRLRYSVHPAAGARDVSLEGAAFFTVAHDSSRVFTIRAESSITQVLGTRFSVRAYRNENVVRVAVQEGRVAFRRLDAPSAIVLSKGEVGELCDTCRLRAAMRQYNATDVVWLGDRLVFDSVEAGRVAAQLSHWYDLHIRVTDTSLTREYLKASLSANDAAQALEALATALNARLERVADTVTLRRN